MKSFKEYWKEKSTKRRKSWLVKSKRYAENHEKLETIRKEVYIPLGSDEILKIVSAFQRKKI
jgi:predicted metal-dependent hydrolase